MNLLTTNFPRDTQIENQPRLQLGTVVPAAAPMDRVFLSKLDNNILPFNEQPRDTPVLF